MNNSKLENARKEAKSVIDNLNIGYKDPTKKTGLGNIHAHKAKICTEPQLLKQLDYTLATV